MLLRQIPEDKKGRSIFDAYTGYRYRPNMEVGPIEDSEFPIHFKTNSHGHIAREDYPVQRPEEEFRIGIVGDSFTANVTNSLRWGDVLEDELNARRDWRERIDGRRTRVINFGLDGIGSVQFDDVVERMVPPFDINLLIVNMIKPDVARRPYYRGHQGDYTEDSIREVVEERILQQMPWFDAYPNTLALVLGYPQRIGLDQAVSLLFGDRFFDDPVEAVEASVASLRRVETIFPGTLYLIHPTYQNYTDNVAGQQAFFLETFDQMRSRTPDLCWVDMRDLVQAPRDQAEVDSWFNVPWDLHNSDLGLTIYGQAVAALLIRGPASVNLGRDDQCRASWGIEPMHSATGSSVQ